jgi:hypothetical protein
MNSKSYLGFSNVVIILVGVVIIAILVGFFRVTRPLSSWHLGSNEPFTLGTLLPDGSNSVGMLTGASENCDIAVTSPIVNTKVSNIITINGLYRNCGWDSTNYNNTNNKAIIGTVMVIDGKGNSLTNPLAITSTTPDVFSFTFGLIRKSQTNSAVIVVRNADDRQPIILQIPVTISQ